MTEGWRSIIILFNVLSVLLHVATIVYLTSGGTTRR